MRIPLSDFILKTGDSPRGRIVATGLCSAMNNPMVSKTDSGINFSSQIIFDYRVRDCDNGVNSERERNMKLDDGYGDDDGAVDDEGFYSTKRTPGASNWKYNAFSYSPVTHRIGTDFMSGCTKMVATLAFKPITAACDWGNDRYVTYFGTGRYSGSFTFDTAIVGTATLLDPRIKLNWRQGAVTTVLGAGDTGVITTGSEDKWIIAELTIDSSTNESTLRLKGGQWTSTTTFTKVAAPPWGDWNFRYIYVPMYRFWRVGYFTVATFDLNNDGGRGGLAEGDIDWNLFDSEHQCNETIVTGNTIQFECQNEVAWEIFVDGVWKNSDGTIGTANRVFYATGTHEVSTDTFSAVRPILKNSGLLNADVLSVLNYVDISYVSPLPVYDFTTISDYLGKAADMHKGAYLPFNDLYTNISEENEKLVLSKKNQEITDQSKSLALSVKNTRINILNNFSQIAYLEGSFNELRKYIEGVSSMTVDEYLSSRGEKVTGSYASVANVLAQDISESNIER